MTQLDSHFLAIYNSLKIMLYEKALKNNDDEEADALTLQEVICMEIIIALGRPTISEFSSVAKLSGSNSAYRIRKLIEKGYINKIQNKEDRREYYLESTGKYDEKYGMTNTYVEEICHKVLNRLNKDELALAEKMLAKINEEVSATAPHTCGRQTAEG